MKLIYKITQFMYLIFSVPGGTCLCFIRKRSKPGKECWKSL